MLSRTEQYIEENQKSISVIVISILVIVCGYFIYKKFILAPREREARDEMYMAEMFFERDSFNIALKGNGNIQGFEQIAEDYGITSTGNLANYYKGVSLLRLGKYQEAIDELLKYDADDRFVNAVTFGAVADAYSELENYEKAVSFYKKAVYQDKNEFTTPIYLKKLALTYEATGQLEDAKKTYEKIKLDFPKCTVAMDIDKYITRVEIKMQQK